MYIIFIYIILHILYVYIYIYIYICIYKVYLINLLYEYLHSDYCTIKPRLHLFIYDILIYILTVYTSLGNKVIYKWLCLCIKT